MTNQQKVSTWTVGGIVVLAIIVFALSRHSTKAPQTMDQNSQQTQNAATTTPPQTKAPAPKLSYGAAVNAYKYRFQFSQCHGNPGSLTVKKGSPVMLDNRDAVAHTIKANGQSFRIAGYDYAVLYPQIPTVG